MELMSVQEAAKKAGVTAKAIYYSIHNGKLTPHRQYGRVLVDVSEVENYKPRAHPLRTVSPVKRVLTGRGFLVGEPGVVDDFIARKAAEKALDR
ncbi:MAG TPA: helix-turn-helix domain-containing protein [Capsulimonadaceae bacterium]|jgi:excisionase family DNA binding protein